MPQLASDRVAQLAHDAGVDTTLLVVAVAIAWAESGLNSDATGENRDPVTHLVTSRDRGLWQINDYWHPDVSDQCAYDPWCNALAMSRISNRGTNWQPWATYNNGAYRNYLTVAQLGVNYYVSGSGGVGGPPPSPGDPATAIGAADAAGANIRNGMNPLLAVAKLLQAYVDEATDARFGPDHRAGPIFGTWVE